MKINRSTFPLIALALSTSGVVVAQGLGHYQPVAASAAAAIAQDGWETPPQEFREIQRQGYHDGIEGARKDFDNHRTPDVNNREEYRHPNVPRSAREDYREGFRRGYERAMSHLMGGPGPR